MLGLSSAPAAGHSVLRQDSVTLHCQPCGHIRCRLLLSSLPDSRSNRHTLQRRKLRLRFRQSRRNVYASSSVRAEQSAPIDTQNAFRWATNVSRHGNVYYAIDETSQACHASFGDPAAEPTVALVFASSSYSVEFDRIIPVLRSKVPSLQHIIGCTGFGVIGGSAEGPQEIEGEPALSLTLGVLPDVTVQAQHISNAQVPDADARQELWQEVMATPIDVPPGHNTSFIIISDPSFWRIQDLLSGLDYAYPEASKLGGFVSAATQTAKRGLFCWSANVQNQSQDGVVQGGAAILSLQGPIRVDPVVAQGCRPLTDSIWTIGKCENNIILEVYRARQGPNWGMPPLVALKEDMCSLNIDDREAVSNNLTLAVAPDDFKNESELGPTDFLIRGIPGMDPKGGAIAVAEAIGIGKRIRFMLRDREGAKQDLQSHALAYKRKELQASMEGKSLGQAFGSIIFSCNGRGRNLFGEQNYDSRKIAEFIPVPSSGFLCNGEIGQIAGRTAMHGFTCAVGVLRANVPEE